MRNSLKFNVSGASTLLFLLDFFSVQYMIRVIDATVHKHDIAAFQCHAIQNRPKYKSKLFNRLSPESGKSKEVYIQRPSPRIRSEDYFAYEISEEMFYPNL